MRITIESNGEPLTVQGVAPVEGVTARDGGPAPAADQQAAGTEMMAINAGAPVVEMDHPLVARAVPAAQASSPTVHDGGPAPDFSEASSPATSAPRPRQGTRRTRR